MSLCSLGPTYFPFFLSERRAIVGKLRVWIPGKSGIEAASYEVCEQHGTPPFGHPLSLISGDPLLSPGE